MSVQRARTDEERPAYILHARPYRETSLLLEMLVWGVGRVGGVARGARGSRSSSRRASLQPFQPLLVRLSGAGDLMTLNAAEVAGPALSLRGDALLAGLYLNELYVRLSPRGESLDALFLAYARALGDLEQGKPVAPTLRCLEYSLLSFGGAMPSVDTDAQGKAVLPDAWYIFDPELGPQPCQQRRSDAVRGAALLSLHSGEALPAEDGAALRRLMRSLIEPLLGGRPLNSWGVLAGLRQHTE